MTLKTFFEKFDTFADAPDAVSKMRQLVLDLAVTGRLLPQRVEWEQRPLKSLAMKIGSGSTPAGGRESYFSEGIPLIRSMNVHFRGFVDTGLVFLSDQQAKLLSNVIVQPDDVLLNITGASIGRVTTAPSEMAGARVNQHVTIIRPSKELLPSFLSLFLASPSVQRMIDDVQVGATRQALTKGMIEQFEIPLPPLAEQKRIVAKVDELMALCDRLEAQQQERQTRHAALARASLARFAEAPTPANLHFLFHKSYTIPPADLRKSILTLAVQGKLVKQDPNDEPASNLITRAQEERRQLVEAGIVKRVKPLEEKGGADEFLELPANWAFCCLDDIALKITDGEHATPAREDEGHYLLSARNVRDGFIDVADVDYVGTEEFERIRKRCDPDAGDILLSCSGSVGRVAVVDADNKYAMVRSAALIKHSQANVDSHYLSLALRSPRLQRQIERSSKQSAQANLFIEPIRRLVAPIPPLAEQRRIVAKVDQLMAFVDELETQLAASRATAKNLLEALVVELTATP
jgi:type I restriction enzyme S subunit